MKLFASSLIVVLFFILSGCKKSGISEQQKEVSDPSLLKGIVFLYDEGWNFADKSGMNVSVENSNPLISTITDSKGAFSLRIDTSIRSFTLIYSKPLYGTFKEYYMRESGTLYQIQQEYYSDKQVKVPVKDNFLISTPNLGRKSTTVVNSIRTALINGELKIICNVSFDNLISSTSDRYVQLFYQKNMPISSFASIPKTVKNLTGAIKIDSNGDNVLNDFCMDCCLKGVGGMQSGDTVYITAYGTSYFSGNYVDRNTGNAVFPTMNFTNTVTPISFVLP